MSNETETLKEIAVLLKPLAESLDALNQHELDLTYDLDALEQRVLELVAKRLEK